MQQINLPWPDLCRLACAACCRGVSLDTLIAALIQQRVARG